LAGLLREALAWRAEKGRREPAEFEARLQEWEARLDARMAEKRRFTDGDHARWARRLRKRRFLRVEPPGGAGPPTGGPGPSQDPSRDPNPCGVGQPASNPEATGPRDADLPDIGPDGPGPASSPVPSPAVGHLITPQTLNKYVLEFSTVEPAPGIRPPHQDVRFDPYRCRSIRHGARIKRWVSEDFQGRVPRDGRCVMALLPYSRRNRRRSYTRKNAWTLAGSLTPGRASRALDRSNPTQGGWSRHQAHASGKRSTERPPARRYGP
jgi:hypothetical protein